jgi:competence protein ComEC
MKVLRFPLARITIYFVLGILFATYAKITPQTTFCLLSISAVLFFIFYFFANKNFIQKAYFGIFTFFLSFVIGITTQVVHNDYFQKDNYIHFCTTENKNHLLEVTLREKLKSSNFNNRYIAVVNRFDNEKSSGKLLLNIEKEGLKTDLEIGNALLIKGEIYPHKKPNNPNQFNYGKYLTTKSILAQMYVGVSDLKINTKIDKNIWYYSAKLRKRIIENLRKSNFNSQELNVVVALILGQQQDISPEILHDYQFAGAVHILSVSGLHVGYLLLFINFLLLRLPKNKMANLARFFIIFFSLWGFAIIAGLSPSVVRSVTMFSFVAGGMCLKRETNIFHTLLVSLLLILVVSPSFLFDVGFQLSYVSLFFIVWLQPLFKQIWHPNNKIKNYFWDILTVSCAAQIGALPLSIYYFHQFPGLFFLTNLVILPAVGLIMAVGVLLMIIAVFSPVWIVLSKTLEYLVFAMNWTIGKIASLEQFIIQDIPLNIWMLFALYLIIIAVVVWFKKPNFTKLIFALIAIFLFQISYFTTHYINQNQQEWIVFHSKKNTIITERIGKNTMLFANDSILKNGDKNGTLKSYLIANFSAITKKEKLGNLLFFDNNTILIIDSLGIFPKNINPNIVVITQSPKINLDRLLTFYHPKVIIADGSNFKSYVKRWKTSCEKMKIPFQATAEKGFYKIEKN